MKKREKISTFLGKDAEFEGKLTFHGVVRIDGQFKGEISAIGNLFVGRDGRVEAKIHISSIVILGEVHGNIIADERIEVHAPGKVLGNIQAPCIVIKEGAIIAGNCRMHQGEETDERKSTAIEEDKSETGL